MITSGILHQPIQPLPRNFLALTRLHLMNESELDPQLLQAYRETHYQVHAPEPFTLHIGQASSELSALHRTHGVKCSAFITAFSPYSQQLSKAENEARQEDFRGELKRRSLRFYEGLGQHPSGNWPGEPSFLVLGLSLEAAKVMGVRLQQNALVWAGVDAVADLVVLR
jgi:hypothetical protein